MTTLTRQEIESSWTWRNRRRVLVVAPILILLAFLANASAQAVLPQDLARTNSDAALTTLAVGFAVFFPSALALSKLYIYSRAMRELSEKGVGAYTK
jgi:hypothetical protein